MIRILCLCAFALVSTNAFACISAFDAAVMKYGGKPPKGYQTNEPVCGDKSFISRQSQEIREKDEEQARQISRDLDAKMQAEREYEQRERLAIDEDRRQSLIQNQLNQLNMNTVPRY